MSEKERLTPQLALGRFLDAVRDEASVNMGFRNRLLDALGVEVIVEGEEEIETLDPIGLALSKSEDRFRRIYEQLGAAQLRRILRESGLATPTDLTRKPKGDLIDMMWSRARNRALERGRG